MIENNYPCLTANNNGDICVTNMSPSYDFCLECFGVCYFFILLFWSGVKFVRGGEIFEMKDEDNIVLNDPMRCVTSVKQGPIINK